MKPIGKDHEIIKTLRRHKKQGFMPGLLVCDELGVLEKYIGAEHAAKMPLKTLLVCEELVTSDYAKGILDELAPKASDVFAVSAKIYELLAEKKNSGGLLGVFEWPELTLDELFQSEYRNIIVIDGLENPGNVGTILRTADAAGFDAVIAVDLKTHINGSKCVSASRGMVFQIPVLETDCETAIAGLAEAGYVIYLGEPEEGERYDQTVYAEKCALVVGSERFGVNDRWFSGPHRRVYIPMSGSMSSLNVGVAASILMYEIKRQKG